MSEENPIPKISIIIPMYDVEEYVGECLDSVLIQTFKDYEVIIVDDCSTDKSCAVVESYMPKFNGKLQLIHTEKNSGNAATPRNIGIKLARGKYMFFLDSDNLIIKTGLAELYKVADDYQADVIDCEKFYTSDTPKLKGATLTVKSFQRSRLITQPSLETSDIGKRIKNLYNFRYGWAVWSKLIRRDFINEHNITFTPTPKYDDLVFTICCLACAKRYVRIPNIVNIYRYRPDSILHSESTYVPFIKDTMDSFIKCFNSCDKFLRNLDYFKNNPEFRYMALDTITKGIFKGFSKIYQKIPAARFDGILRSVFATHGDSSTFATFFFSISNLYELRLRELLTVNQRT